MIRLFRSSLPRCQPCRLLCTCVGCWGFPCTLTPHILPLPAVLEGHRAAAVVMPAVDVLRFLAVFIPPRILRTPRAAVSVGCPGDVTFQPHSAAEVRLLLHEVIVKGHRDRRRRACTPHDLPVFNAGFDQKTVRGTTIFGDSGEICGRTRFFACTGKKRS